MKIAIIDSGIDLQHKAFKGKSIECVDLENGIQDENGHGTACCGECLLADKESDLLVIKVLDKSASGSLLSMVSALEYCYKRRDIGIISISISCVVDDKEVRQYIQELVDKLYDKGVLIVAADENGKDTGFPSSLRHVMGVVYKKAKGNTEFFIHIGEKGFYYGKNRLMPWIGKTYKFFSGNSSAVPRAAALMNKNICKRYCQPSKLLRKSGILYYRQERQRIIEHQKFTEIMSECRKLWITNGGWKTEEDCIKMIQFVEEGGHIEIDRKTFSTSDFSSYHNFYKKCSTYLARRI